MVAPYRVDLFNRLWNNYDMTMCIDTKEDYALLYGNIEDDYEFRYETFDTHGNILTAIKYVVRKLKKSKPEVVIVSECGIVSLVVVLYRMFTLKKYRVISIIDDSFDQLINKKQFSKKHSTAEKVLIPRFDEVINVEPNVSEFFQRKYGKGVYFPIIRDENKYRNSLMNSLEISNNYVKSYNLFETKVILYVGRFVKIKNIERLIKAFNSIDRDDIKLVLIGTGEENHLRELAGNDKILFMGKQTGNNLYGWYNVADIFILPSLVEPFGAVTNEALMSGCKCVVSKAAGSACLIEDGVNGYKFTPTDVNDIREKLLISISEVKRSEKYPIVKDNLMKTTFEIEFNKITKVL